MDGIGKKTVMFNHHDTEIREQKRPNFYEAKLKLFKSPGTINNLIKIG